MPAYYWIRQQLFFVKNAKLKGQIGVEHRNVERRGVIDRVNVRSAVVDLAESDDTKGRKYRLHDQSCPGAGEGVKKAAIAVEETKGNRGKAEGNGVEPDQRI